jgi:dolichol-phosphate mannosyltransferase
MRDSLVIVPTYNEADNLERLLRAVIRQSPSRPFDVLVVDDNSPDGTGELAELLVAEWPERLAVLRRPGKLGLGSAYLDGFHHALANGYQHVFEMDADFSHDPAQLPVLRSALNHADVVLGSRYIRRGAARRWPFWRRVLSQGGSIYAGAVLGLPFQDLTSGFKAFRAAALAALDLDAIHSNGYAFQIEVTYQCFRRGFRILEHPIVFGPRSAGRSKMDARIVVEALLLVPRLRFASRPVGLRRKIPT